MHMMKEKMVKPNEKKQYHLDIQGKTSKRMERGCVFEIKPMDHFLVCICGVGVHCSMPTQSHVYATMLSPTGFQGS